MRKPRSRRNSNPHLPEEAKIDEGQFTLCPKGHNLPHRTNRGNCSPLFCMGSTPGKEKSPAALATAEAKDIVAATDVGDEELDDLKEAATRISKQATKHRARMSYLKVPEFKDAKERERWVEDKKNELVPLALADVEFSLKLGDSSEREKARKEVLEMTGHGRRDSGGGSTSPLIILTGMSGNMGENPWVRRIDKDGKEQPVKVIDAGGTS